jgi:hypothetical protein
VFWVELQVDEAPGSKYAGQFANALIEALQK